jgi:hypothetical protein
MDGSHRGLPSSLGADGHGGDGTRLRVAVDQQHVPPGPGPRDRELQGERRLADPPLVFATAMINGVRPLRRSRETISRHALLDQSNM